MEHSSESEIEEQEMESMGGDYAARSSQQGQHGAFTGSVPLPVFDGHPDNCVAMWNTLVNAIFLARNVPVAPRFGLVMSGLSQTALQWYSTTFALRPTHYLLKALGTHFNRKLPRLLRDRTERST